MTIVRCYTNPEEIPKRPGKNRIPVLLYGSSNKSNSGFAIGNQLIPAAERVQVELSDQTFDFLSLALGVVAADTFVPRLSSPDGWARQIELDIELANPAKWKPHLSELESVLRFLSGDLWTLRVRGGGMPPPELNKHRHLRPDIDGADCVCLFSGGLDSAIGTLDLLAPKRTPVLVSHAYPKDRQVQSELISAFADPPAHFSVAADPFSPEGSPTESSMRTRSLGFIAFGSLIASALALRAGLDEVPLLIPENGLISLNPPLTPRRTGALSTRTTHPHFLARLQAVFEAVSIPARMLNPYRHKTKGEMMSECRDQHCLKQVASMTVSCGKWKRKNQQCGRCVPCIIRRSAFDHAGMNDRTSYRFSDLSDVASDQANRDDLMALAIAIRRSRSRRLAPWIAQNGPLGSDPQARSQYVDVVRRGLGEIEVYLQSQGVPV